MPSEEPVAQRPVFVPDPEGSLVEERSIDFEWFPGFAISQKQMSIRSLHLSAADRHGLSRVLEVSTKSPERLGTQLSAFNLRVRVDERSDPILLEAAFQGSKVFRNAGGPFPQLYSKRSGREIKRYMKQFAGDELIEFSCGGESWPLNPRTAFYDWLYIRALRMLGQHEHGFHKRLCDYQAFTDIEFNPAKSVNCQARSCALYVALLQRDGDEHLDTLVSDRHEFLSMLERRRYIADFPAKAPNRRQIPLFT